jgi:hypothetical protein
MERINSYRARKQREVDREMAERETRVNLRAAVARDGFVVQHSDAELLQRQGAAGGEKAAVGSQAASPCMAEAGTGDGGSGRPGGGRWVSQLAALRGKAQDSLDRGRMRIAHRRGQSLGASPLDPSLYEG